MLEHQHQLAAAAAEMRRGQHAGARRRNQMRDAERRAENAGAFVHRRRHQLADLRRRFVFFTQAGVAIKHRQRDEGAALMADGAEIAVGDQAQGFLAAVVGMHAPADIGEQAGGVAQAAIFRGLTQLHHSHQSISPCDQFLGVARGA